VPRRLILARLAAFALPLFACAPGAGDNAPAANTFDPSRFVADEPTLDAPYIASDYDVVDAMLALAEVRPNDDVIDLGSGDGRILIAAARSHGARGLGVDIDPARVREAIANAHAAGVANRVVFRQQDLFRTPLANADVLTLYLTPEVNLRLKSRIQGQMRPGTRVVSEDFAMGDWRPEQHKRIGDTDLYMWIVPARLAGQWTLHLGEQQLPVTFTQHNQELGGTIGAGEAATRVAQGWVTGTEVSFVAEIGGRTRSFEGRVQDGTLVPRQAGAGWRAVRAG
jgi:SAM-dependent methyltransferase